MIHYALRCAQAHAFDGWFRDSAAFEAQASDGRLECPVCADRAVARAPMAPNVARRRKATAVPAAAATSEKGAVVPAEASEPAMTNTALPDGARAMLQKLRAEVERRCDYVGDGFAETVRAMHRGEEAVRGVYGEASAEQAETLRDEGIEVASIPWVKRADA